MGKMFKMHGKRMEILGCYVKAKYVKVSGWQWRPSHAQILIKHQESVRDNYISSIDNTRIKSIECLMNNNTNTMNRVKRRSNDVDA